MSLPTPWPKTAGMALMIVLSGVADAGGDAVVFPSGESPHIVFAPGTPLERQAEERLAEYMGKVLGAPAQLVAGTQALASGVPVIILSAGGREPASGISAPAHSPEAFALATRKLHGRPAVIVVGQGERGLKRGVQRLIVASEQRAPGLVIPALNLAASPWIPQREYALSSWDPAFARGIFANPNADTRLNPYLYGPEQIANYVAMFDAFGFSGCQLLESCKSFHDRGSPEADQSVLRALARAAHRQGQDVTLRVWAAQFNGYGWVDPTVVYAPARGRSAFADPKVRATFEKYYDLYAGMAPDVDRLIAHFYDPGSLPSREDVFSYLGLLRDKFKAKNPRLTLAVDFWAVAQGDGADVYMRQLADHGFGDALLLETSMPSYWPAGRREALHEEAKRRGLHLGVWGWYTTEMETDQMPAMHVNAHLLSRFYRQVRDGAARIQPLTYWSEMEAYHLNNIFTMYAAAQLLWNPGRDPDAILHEIADGIYGPIRGEAVFRALRLIEDVRSGPSWDTYWRWLPTHRLGTDDPASDLRRADEAIATFVRLSPDPAFVPKFPLPFPPATWIELTLPHLRQIRQFAAFRLQLAAMRAAAGQGASKARLTQLAQAAWQPVPDYNTWIGVWGQLEDVAQERAIREFAQEFGLDVKTPAAMRYRDAGRLLQAIQNHQRTLATPWRFRSDAGWFRSSSAFYLWSEDKLSDRLQLLLENGAIESTGGGTCQLTNWNEYRLR